MLLSSLWSSENVSNITLLDEVKCTTGVQAPAPHHLKYYQIMHQKPQSISHIPVIFAEKLDRITRYLVICFRSIPLATTSLLFLHPTDATRNAGFPALRLSHSG